MAKQQPILFHLRYTVQGKNRTYLSEKKGVFFFPNNCF